MLAASGDWIFYFRGAERLLIVGAAAMSIYLGYKLFIMGVTGKASLLVQYEKSKLQLINAAPGLFFALFGALVLAVAISRPAITSRPGDVLVPSDFLEYYHIGPIRPQDSRIPTSQSSLIDLIRATTQASTTSPAESEP